MMQKRTLSVYFSMTENNKMSSIQIFNSSSLYYVLYMTHEIIMRLFLLLLSAFCASIVMASASSRMISLNADLYMVPVLAKLKI